MRVILDANIFVSYLLSPDREGVIHTIIESLFDGVFILLLSDILLNEISKTVISKKYVSERVHLDDIDKMISILLSIAEILPPIPEPIPQICRDRKDDYLLALGLLSKADYIVSGDEDLVSLQSIRDMIIVTPSQFVHLLSN